MSKTLPTLPEVMREHLSYFTNDAQQELTASIESYAIAATAPLLERIAELEQELACERVISFRNQVAELEQQLSEARKDAQIIRNQALEDAAKCCDGLHAPESCSQVESSLWDVATLAAGDAIRAMKKEQP